MGGCSCPKVGVALILCGGCVWGLLVFLGGGGVLMSCGSEGRLLAGGRGHVCWVISMTRTLTFNGKGPDFQ